MKPIFKILLCFWVVFTLSVFIPIFLLAQKPPHLDSLIFLPDNELMPIDPNPTPEFSPEYRYPDFGFEINPTSSEYRSKEDIWRNAPIIVEGRTMKGMLQEERNKYPALFLSNKEVYEVYPYALSYVYRGDVIGDTIYILLPRYNYNKVQAPDPNGHDCKAFVYAPNLYSIAFLKPIEIDGYTYYSPCNTNYEGFEWVNELAKFIEDRCFVQAYSKNDILQTFSEKGDPLQVKRSIAEERKQKEAERKKHISPKKSDAIPVTGQKIEEYIRDKGWLRTVRQNIKLRGNDDFIYSIGDMEFYASGMDQYDLEFKVYGTAEQNRNFGAALLFLEYNSDVFGDSIMAHAKLSVFKAPAFAGSNYSLLSADDSDNVFGVSLVFTDFINNLGLLLPAGSKVHLYTVYITFSRSGCNNKPDFKPSEWDRVNFITHYMHPIDSSFTNYDTVTIEPIPNPTLCPYPQITTSFKNIVGKRAGVGDTLEIKGINFGTTGGYVAFKDANFGSGLYTKGLESQYLLSWTDTLIKVLIPSYTTKNYPSGTRGCAGSGLVKVYTMNGDSAISSDTLKIEFAQLNDFKTLKYYPVYLCKNFCVNGFVYTLDSSMIGHSDMITAIEYCLKQWSDFTGLRLELEKDNSGKNIYLNKVSDFRFRNFISLDSISAIMVTSSSFTTGDNAPNKIIVRTNSSNISINKSLKFWYKPDGDKPNEYYDFISTFLHELGHVLNIGHDVHYEHGLKSLMYFGGGSSFESAPDRLNLLQWGDEAKNGVQYVIDKSKIQPLNEFANIKPLFSGNLPALSIAPIISPSKDTVLCAEKLASYTLKSNFISNNIWNTNQTTQSIVLTPPSFPGGQTESSSYYTVKQWNENCTVASKPSLPVKVTWKKYCLRPPGDDKFFDGDISTRFASELNSKLYPNPFTSGIEIDIKDVLQGELIINVFNSNGDIVINRTLSVESGSFHDFVSMDKYNSGIYTIKIQNGNKVNIQQIVKAE